ncbi:MAG: murein biosynthesis integral membrane protein MurJ [Chloroflexota bacterium]
MTQTRTLSNSQIARAAVVVLLGFLASGALGLVRTAVIAAAFGTSNELDAFLAAQRVPEALFVLVAGGALGSAFVPVFSRYLKDDADHEKAWQLASATMTLSAGAAGVLSIIALVTAPLYVPLYAPAGSGEGVQQLTIRLTQIMLLTPFIFSISGLLMGILNAHQSFTLPAIAIGMNNIGLIIGALVFAQMLPAQNGGANVYGLAMGAVLGALLHLAVQLPGLRGIRAKLRLLPDWNIEGVREVITLMGPRVLGLAVVQINFIVNVRLAFPMVEGSVAALTIAWTLMFFALGIIAQSVGTALFPTLSALAADNDMVGFRGRLSTAMRSVLFLSIPATVVLVMLGEPLVAVIAQRGEWTLEDSQATAWALAFFAIGIAGHSLLEVLSRAFYALSDTWTPVWVGLIAMISNITLSLVFIQFIGEPGNLARGPFAGLALANSVTTLVEGAVLWWLMRWRIGSVNDAYVLDAVWRTGAASVVMGACIFGVTQVAGELPPLFSLMLNGIAGGAVFFGVALLLRMNEARAVPALILRRVRSS